MSTHTRQAYEAAINRERLNEMEAVHILGFDFRRGLKRQ